VSSLSHSLRRLPSGKVVELCAFVLCLAVTLLSPERLIFGAAAQEQAKTSSTPAAATAQQQQPDGEMAVNDDASISPVSEAARFRVNVHLVLARVVVRDSNGHVVGNLHKEDFEIFDNGKLQVISNFDSEHVAQPPLATTVAAAPDSSSPAIKPQFPQRYVAYLFDDIHLKFGDMAMVRNAAHKMIDALPPTDRAAVFSTSGQTNLDFTDDRAKLNQTLDKLMPRPISGDLSPCPPMTFYQADLIVNKRDRQALETGIVDYLACSGLPQAAVSTAEPVVEGKASEVLSIGEHESRLSLLVLKDAVRRIVAVPGQRNLVLISPGFLTPDLEYDNNELIDRALRAQVVINSLDARGLYVPTVAADASQPGPVEAPNLKNLRLTESFAAAGHTLMDTQEASADADVLSVLANGTGGTFIQNTNDLEGGLKRVLQPPEYYYILGFTPQSLKTDGKFHTIKVRLKTGQKYDLQARRGYYAPKKAEDPAEEAKREVEDEVLSSEELHDLPVALHTQFFKASDDSAKLTVMARIDVKRLHYKRADDRSQNDLTVVTAVFDRNGNMIQANEKLVQMRWKSETLQTKLASGITLKSSFDVKPGRYMVRVVTRDTEQQLMSAENGAVEIP